MKRMGGFLLFLFRSLLSKKEHPASWKEGEGRASRVPDLTHLSAGCLVSYSPLQSG
jgi:hypothetical protein